MAKTKIFLDSGDPAETREILSLLGYLDGQTTNPTLIAASPAAKARYQQGKALNHDDIMALYRAAAGEISSLIPAGSISLEVYADERTTAEEMMRQAREMYIWIPNAHIKFPVTAAGLAAAEKAVSEGMRVNMTLCFSQQQAAAVYAATAGAKKGQVFISPFAGRLDDTGKNGMDLIANIVNMYREGDGHVEVLAASIRTTDHFFASLRLGADTVTAPAKVLREWAGKGRPMPPENWTYRPAHLAPIPYENLDLTANWQTFEITHDLTASGITRFSFDWNALIEKR